MRIVFVGSVEASVVALKSLLAAGMKPALVATLPPEAASRHSDFADLGAIAGGLPVHRTTDINAAKSLDAVKAVRPDLCLVVGWSQICGPDFRGIARIGTVGFHPAPLPRLRGRAVIPWTLLEGDTTTASTFFWLGEGVDSGDILLQRPFDVSPDETARALYEKHTSNIASMAPEAVRLAFLEAPPRVPQDHTLATYGARRTRDDGLIDWRQPAEAILRLIRAVGDPYPGAFTYYDNQNLIIDAAVLHPLSGRFVGLAGQVQAVEDGKVVVRCGDEKCIILTRWRSAPAVMPRVHRKFQSEPCP